MVKYLLNIPRVDVNLTDNINDRTPLMWASLRSSKLILTYMLRKVDINFEVNQADRKYRNTVLHNIIWFSEIDEIDEYYETFELHRLLNLAKKDRYRLREKSLYLETYLVEKRCKKTTKRQLYGAAKDGSLERVIQLSAESKDNVEVMSETLIESCNSFNVGYPFITEWLIVNTEAKVNYRGSQWTPLTRTICAENLCVVEYLLHPCFADVNLPNKSDGYTPLIWACRNGGKLNILKHLLCEAYYNLNVNVTNEEGNTALHYVMWNTKHATSLHTACREGDLTEVMRLILKCNNMINIQNSVGDTALHDACIAGHNVIAEMLLLAGADETITNDNRKTASHYFQYTIV